MCQSCICTGTGWPRRWTRTCLLDFPAVHLIRWEACLCCLLWLNYTSTQTLVLSLFLLSRSPRWSHLPHSDASRLFVALAQQAQVESVNWSLLLAYSAITLHAPQLQSQRKGFRWLSVLSVKPLCLVVCPGRPWNCFEGHCQDLELFRIQVLLAFPVPFHSGAETLEAWRGTLKAASWSEPARISIAAAGDAGHPIRCLEARFAWPDYATAASAATWLFQSPRARVSENRQPFSLQ